MCHCAFLQMVGGGVVNEDREGGTWLEQNCWEYAGVHLLNSVNNKQLWAEYFGGRPQESVTVQSLVTMAD